ncbi:MAG: hypothetical protein ACM3PP_01475, partial [Candidatus Saccharibacteria bacterium]
GATKNINSMKMNWSATNYPRSYVVYKWTGSAWQAVKTVAGDGNMDTATFSTPVQSRWVLLQLSQPNSSYYCLYDWQVLGSSLASNGLLSETPPTAPDQPNRRHQRDKIQTLSKDIPE